jgi:hypothetical protein
MAIEFRCGQCDSLLRVPDDTAGRQAQCPHCNGLTTVPDATIPSASGWPPRQPEPINPYQAPSADYRGPAAVAPVPAGPIVRTPIEIEDIFRRTWTIFKREMGTCVVAGLIFLGLNLVVNVPVSLVSNTVIADLDDPGGKVVVWTFSNLLTTAYTTWLEIGMAVFMLKIARGQPTAYGDLFTGLDFFVPVVLAKLLFSIAVGIGTVLCIVPGVVLALMMFQYFYLIIDRNAGIAESLSMSMELTQGSRLSWLAVFLATLFGGLIVTLLTCGVGILLYVPFYSLVFAVGYLAMTGQPTADRSYAAAQPLDVSPFQQYSS